MKRIVTLIGLFSIIFFMISNATAVPQLNSEKLTEIKTNNLDIYSKTETSILDKNEVVQILKEKINFNNNGFETTGIITGLLLLPFAFLSACRFSFYTQKPATKSLNANPWKKRCGRP